MNTDTQIVKIRGYDIRMQVRGEGAPLLLINGLTGPLEAWDAFAAFLPDRMLISFDAPGVGYSPTPVYPLSMLSLAQLATWVLNTVGVERADVLGFSHGGAVAQQMAWMYPDQVNRLVLASTLCGVGSVPGNMKALYDMRTPGIDPVGAFWRLLAICSWSSIPFLHSIQAPTLVIGGSLDTIVVPANVEYLAQRIPNAKLVMLNSTHDIQRLHPGTFAIAVSDFLSSDYIDYEMEMAA